MERMFFDKQIFKLFYFIVKLYNIINNSCDQLLHIKKQLSTYLTLRWYTLWKIRKNQCKIRKGETVQFLDLERTIKNASLSNKKPKVVRITKLLAKIKTLIFEHKVRQLDIKVAINID